MRYLPSSVQWLALALTLVVGPVALAGETAEVLRQDSPRVPLQRSDSARARDWGLTEQEWARFEALKAGPRGYWSPQLDPLTALGVEAETAQERQRYAELQVHLEAQRAARELAYQQAYDAAWARLFPGLLPVQGLADEAPRQSPVAARLALFVKADCPACQAKARQLQADGTVFDLYLVGSQGEDARLRAWARQAGLEPARVQRRQISLNHDHGQWQRLGAPGPLPASLQQVNGQWQRLD